MSQDNALAVQTVGDYLNSDLGEDYEELKQKYSTGFRHSPHPGLSAINTLLDGQGVLTKENRRSVEVETSEYTLRIERYPDSTKAIAVETERGQETFEDAEELYEFIERDRILESRAS